MIKEMVANFFSENYIRAREIHYSLLPLTNAMFVETNPIPVKTALGIMGYNVGSFRLPLAPPNEGSLKIIKDALKQTGVL